jgi:signal transduction histidine kinase/ligand-binding sensor domain-containing protein
MSKRASDSAKSCRGVFGISLGWMLVVGISLVTRCLGELTDYPVARFTVTDDGRLQPEAPDPKEPLEVVLGARVRGARWVHPADLPEGALDGPPPLQPSWQVQTWRVEQGLPENEIKALCQTSDGYLWVGTPSGLARFDGNRFVVFNQRNTQVLHEIRDDIRVLRTDREGRLWVGAQQGIARFDRGRWEKVCQLDLDRTDRLRDFSMGADGTVWVGSRRGLLRVMDGKPTSDGIPKVLREWEACAVLVTDDGAVWSSALIGTSRWMPGEDLTSLEWQSGHNNSIAGSFVQTPDGAVWSGSSGALRKIMPEGVRSYLLPEGDFPASPLAPGMISIGRTGELYSVVGSQWALCTMTGDTLVPIADQDGIPVEGVSCVQVDHEGAVWAGTRGNGLLRLAAKGIQAMGAEEPYRLRAAASALEGPTGEWWFGTASGLVQCGGGGALAVKFSDWGALGAKTHGLGRGNDGMVWASLLHRGVFKVSPALAPSASETNGLLMGSVGAEFGQVRTVVFGEMGTLWLGTTTNGLIRLGASREPTRLGLAQDLGNRSVRVLHRGRHGDLWVGMALAGLARLPDAEQAMASTQLERWTQENGLPGQSVWALHEDNQGKLWIGTDRGLACLVGDPMRMVPIATAPLASPIHSIVEDDHGFMWVSSQRGLHRASRSELDAFLEGRSHQVAWVSFSETDGMPNSSTAGENQSAGFKARDGRLVFPTAGGLAIVDPSHRDLVLPPPSLVIEQVLADGKAVAGNDHPEPAVTAKERMQPTPLVSPEAEHQMPFHLGPGRARDLRIRYTATSLTAPERLRFEYRLEGLETEWRPGGAERMAYYTNLKPGNYRFQVRAANHQGTWSEAPAEWAFRLEPAFHQTALFPLTIALVGVAVAGGFTLWRLSWQRKVMLLEQRVALDRERKRIARDMHDDLGAQLSTLALQLSGTSEATARTSADAQHKVRDVIRHLNSLIWAVEPGHESVEALTDFLGNFAQEYLGRAGLRTSLECSESSGMQASLSTEARRHVVAVVKEALRNVVRHAHATEVRLRFAVQETTLVVEIEDDGQGFDASRAPQDRGLGHMKERLSEVGGRCDVASVPGKGTRIRIAVGLGDVAKPKNPVSLGY